MDIDPLTHRQADHAIDPLFLQRWSPRAMSGEALDDGQLESLFEAARWAPSSYNEQPWTFLYAKRDTPAWERFFGTLIEFNQSWCKNAAVLVCIVARLNFSHNGTPNVAHVFDCGAGWENMALQATRMGLVTHGMTGFDFAKARADLAVPDNFAVAAMIAIGKPGDPATLPEAVRARELPSGRKPLAEIVKEGGF